MLKYESEIRRAYSSVGFTPRDNQLEVINNIVSSFIDEQHENVILCAGTGHGKSIIGLITSIVMKEITGRKDDVSNIIMNTNVLIDQYNNSFMGVKGYFYRKGANNYECAFMTAKKGHKSMGDILSAEYCVGMGEVLKGKCPDIYCKNCEFHKLREIQNMADYVAQNYSYWMMKTINSKKPPRKALLLNIYDEAHTINDVFTTFAAVELNTKLIDYIINIDNFIPGFTSGLNGIVALRESLKHIQVADEFNFTGQKLSASEKLKKSIEIGNQNYEHFSQICDAIEPLLLNVVKKLEKEKENIDPNEEPELYIKIVRAYNRMTNVANQLQLIKDDKEVLFEKVEDHKEGIYGIKASPIFIKKYWSVLNKASYNLFMSATITEDIIKKTIELRGSTKFIYVPSSFPKENKLIVSYKPQYLNYTSMQDPNVIKRIIDSCCEIVDISDDNKGIILTTTFDLTRKVCDALRSRCQTKIFEHQQGEKIADVLDSFKKYSGASVLVSPSLWEGISLDDDLSRFQIICKTPYGSLASKRNKYVQVRLPEIYQQQTLLTLIQGFGRSVRNKDDFCITYCLDAITFNEINKHYNVWKDDFTYEYIN